MKAGTLSAAVVLAASFGMASGAAVAAGERTPAAPIVLAQQRPQLRPALPPELMPRTHGRRGRSSSALDPLGPPPLPPDPMQKQDEAIRRALSDPALRAGLPPNAKLTPPPEPAPSTTVLPDRFQPLDRDRDGRITRDEYMRGRDRVPPASFATDTRQRIMRQRLDSQFRQADRNRDGAITPDELQGKINPRF